MGYCIFSDLGHYDVRNESDIVGKFHDVYLDEESWKIQWFVVETGHWFSSNKVLLDPSQIVNLSPETGNMDIAVSKDDIENAPSADEHPPVSEQKSKSFSYYAASNNLLLIPGYSGLMMPTTLVERPIKATDFEQDIPQAPVQEGDKHLRSAREIDGYTVAAPDGSLGPVSDFVINTDTWSIDLLALDTSKWLPGRTVVISTRAVDQISWERRKVFVSLDKETLEQSPELGDLKSIETSYINKFNAYYRYPIY